MVLFIKREGRARWRCGIPARSFHTTFHTMMKSVSDLCIHDDASSMIISLRAVSDGP